MVKQTILIRKIVSNWFEVVFRKSERAFFFRLFSHQKIQNLIFYVQILEYLGVGLIFPRQPVDRGAWVEWGLFACPSFCAVRSPWFEPAFCFVHVTIKRPYRITYCRFFVFDTVSVFFKHGSGVWSHLLVVSGLFAPQFSLAGPRSISRNLINSHQPCSAGFGKVLSKRSPHSMTSPQPHFLRKHHAKRMTIRGLRSSISFSFSYQSLRKTNTFNLVPISKIQEIPLPTGWFSTFSFHSMRYVTSFLANNIYHFQLKVVFSPGLGGSERPGSVSWNWANFSGHFASSTDEFSYNFRDLYRKYSRWSSLRRLAVHAGSGRSLRHSARCVAQWHRRTRSMHIYSPIRISFYGRGSHNLRPSCTIEGFSFGS